jgi:hypothetical protein
MLPLLRLPTPPEHDQAAAPGNPYDLLALGPLGFTGGLPTPPLANLGPSLGAGMDWLAGPLGWGDGTDDLVYRGGPAGGGGWDNLGGQPLPYLGGPIERQDFASLGSRSRAARPRMAPGNGAALAPGQAAAGGGSALEQAIDAATDDPRIRQAMRLAAMLEGGNLDGDWGVGDEGYSHGAFQIYTKVHNVTPDQARDPNFATRFMLPHFQAALQRVPAGLWESDPMRAAALTAYYAEKPATMYDTGRVRAGWQALQERGRRAARGVGTTDAQALTTAQAAAGGALTPNQFASGLSAGDAASACGPAAAVAFARYHGRNPTLHEAVNLARQVGWRPNQGMAGPASQVALLNRMGIAARLDQGVDWQQVARTVASGRPVILDSPQHYFVAEGYDPRTGRFDFGNSALVLRRSGGRRWLTPAEVAGLGAGYAPRSTIYMEG